MSSRPSLAALVGASILLVACGGDLPTAQSPQRPSTAVTSEDGATFRTESVRICIGAGCLGTRPNGPDACPDTTVEVGTSALVLGFGCTSPGVVVTNDGLNPVHINFAEKVNLSLPSIEPGAFLKHGFPGSDVRYISFVTASGQTTVHLDFPPYGSDPLPDEY